MIHCRSWTTGDENAPEEPTLQLTITGESISEFKELINRALNCWDSAPADLKSLGDMLTQDHEIQKINSRKESNPEYGTTDEMKRVEDYIAEHGLDSWRTLILQGKAHTVTNPKTK